MPGWPYFGMSIPNVGIMFKKARPAAKTPARSNHNYLFLLLFLFLCNKKIRMMKAFLYLEMTIDSHLRGKVCCHKNLNVIICPYVRAVSDGRSILVRLL